MRWLKIPIHTSVPFNKTIKPRIVMVLLTDPLLNVRKSQSKFYHLFIIEIHDKENIKYMAGSLASGLWGDASSWSKVIPFLQDAGHKVIAVELPLHSLADDIATVKRAIDLICLVATSREALTRFSTTPYNIQVVSVPVFL